MSSAETTFGEPYQNFINDVNQMALNVFNETAKWDTPYRRFINVAFAAHGIPNTHGMPYCFNEGMKPTQALAYRVGHLMSSLGGGYQVLSWTVDLDEVEEGLKDELLQFSKSGDHTELMEVLNRLAQRTNFLMKYERYMAVRDLFKGIYHDAQNAHIQALVEREGQYLTMQEITMGLETHFFSIANSAFKAFGQGWGVGEVPMPTVRSGRMYGREYQIFALEDPSHAAVRSSDLVSRFQRSGKLGLLQTFGVMGDATNGRNRFAAEAESNWTLLNNTFVRLAAFLKGYYGGHFDYLPNDSSLMGQFLTDLAIESSSFAHKHGDVGANMPPNCPVMNRVPIGFGRYAAMMIPKITLDSDLHQALQRHQRLKKALMSA